MDGCSVLDAVTVASCCQLLNPTESRRDKLVLSVSCTRRCIRTAALKRLNRRTHAKRVIYHYVVPSRCFRWRVSLFIFFSNIYAFPLSSVRSLSVPWSSVGQSPWIFPLEHISPHSFNFTPTFVDMRLADALFYRSCDIIAITEMFGINCCFTMTESTQVC